MYFLLSIAALSYSGAFMAVVILLLRISEADQGSVIKALPVESAGPLTMTWLRDLSARHAALVLEGRRWIVHSPADCVAFAKRLHRCELRFASGRLYARVLLMLRPAAE